MDTDDRCADRYAAYAELSDYERARVDSVRTIIERLSLATGRAHVLSVTEAREALATIYRFAALIGDIVADSADSADNPGPTMGAAGITADVRAGAMALEIEEAAE